MQDVNLNSFSERAVLVGVIHKDQNELETIDYLDELELLAKTSGAKVVKTFIQKKYFLSPSTFIGKGKVNEIKEFISLNKINLVVFDDELTASQFRNIERILKCKVLDRANLILDIFALRAKTSYAKVQVELAQYSYLLPRLTRMWTHLSKQQGGIGTKGPGEKEIETDRRIIRNKISVLKQKLKKIDKQRKVQRKSRQNILKISLVGYTNAGKSTLMNLLTKSNLLAEDKLFATLDTTVRKIYLHNKNMLISDTVGFIRKLPYQLIESFKSTLDDILDSDILLHVVDLSSDNFEKHIDIVNKTLFEIGASNKRQILVFNKIDKLNNTQNTNKDEVLSLEQTWMNKNNKKSVFISAYKKTNIEKLKRTILI